jgi:hypothetical protein
MCSPMQPTKPTDDFTPSSVTVNCSNETEEICICKTVFEKPEKQVNLKDLLSDKAALKRSDPFLYFSIPTVRSETLGMQVNDADGNYTEGSSGITRKSRVSVECHANLVYEELFSCLEDPPQ